MSNKADEKYLESFIENYLINNNKFISVSSENYDKERCIIPSELIAFIKESQSEEYNKLKEFEGDRVDQTIISNFVKYINKFKNKTLDAFRKKIAISGVYFDLVFFQPENNKTKEHADKYNKNRFSLIRQLYYSNKNKNSIDLVIFLNGLPLFTLELKNALTGQYLDNAIRQYMKDRNPKESLFEFKRCLAHFAVSTEKVSLTTELKKDKTFFLPFNKSLINENPNGYATAYLWEDIFTKDSILDLLQNYITIQVNSDKYFDEKTSSIKEKKSSVLIFPRFHQRRVVKRLLMAVKKDGVGNKYLIQHSAGSGKSNSIAWLAHRLSSLFQKPSDNNALFKSVIVVTDRRVLNKQIQDTIRQFEDVPGVVAYIDEKKTSQDLKAAIEANKRIIVTTIQKFPVISEVVAHMPDKKYAVIIDEAHSSQTGESARHLRKSLSLEEAEQIDSSDKTLEDVIVEDIKSKGSNNNISFFAFTATPKEKTIELFGTLKNAKKAAFDIYSMEQAIKEDFIIDVLNNYSSFSRYYKLVTKTKANEDKEYDKKKTVRLLSSFVDLQDHAIEKKARIMIEHFISSTQNEIQGKARAMVVTKSRLHAVRFKKKFDSIMRDMKLPYAALVAFSGTVKDNDNDEEYTENSMNNLTGKISIPDALKMPKYRILIVANKFQTGYDEPLLHTMFVDKKLGGASTVQTLSRLNRKTKGKDSTMVLDFVNDPEDVKNDFQFYYGENFMEEHNQTDPNDIYLLKDTIENYHLIYQNDLDAFANIIYRDNSSLEKLQPILNDVVKRFIDDLSEEQQGTFKADARAFIKFYRFLCQIVKFADPELEKYYIFLTALVKKIPYTPNALPVEVLQDVQLDSYKIQYNFTKQLELESKNSEVTGLKPGTSSPNEEEFDFLSKIIQILNETYGLDLTDEDKIDFEKMKERINNNEQLMDFFNPNNTKDNIKERFYEQIDSELLDFINTKLELYNKLSSDKVNSMFKNLWFNEIYDHKLRGINL